MNSESGFTLIEVITALVVSIIAILGLAYSFGTGRALIDRFAVSRQALAAAQGRMEELSLLAPTDTSLAVGVPHGRDFIVDGRVLGVQSWTVAWVDDPSDNSPSDANPNDLKRVTLEVSFGQRGVIDRVTLTRLFSAQ